MELAGPSPLSIWWAVRRATHVVIWLAAEHAFYAVLSSKVRGIPSLLVLGGQEGASASRIGYGLWQRPWHVRWRARAAIRGATELWTVEPDLAARTFRLGRLPPRAFRVVHTIFDPSAIRPLPEKDLDVAFVCVTANPASALNKGLAFLNQLAIALPGSNFVVLGTKAPKNLPPPANVQYLGFLPHNAYAEVLGRAKVVFNASHHEGLNNGVCEGMLAGAVPVVTRIPGNLHAIGTLETRGHAFTYEAGDLEDCLRSLRRALRAGEEDGVRQTIREDIIARFPVSARIDAFQSFLGI